MNALKAWVQRYQLASLVLLTVLLAVVLPLALDVFRLNLVGKYLTYAFVAIGLVMVWGYGGVLSLGQGVFFGLGGYAMAMFLKLEASDPISTKIQSTPGIPDFMDWNQITALPAFWVPFKSLPFALAAVVVVPTLLAWIVSFAMFKRRVGGVYFAIITQAVALICTVLIIGQQGYTGGVNGMTDLKTLWGWDTRTDSAKVILYYVCVALLVASIVLCRYIQTSKLGTLLLAMRDKEDRVRYQPPAASDTPYGNVGGAGYVRVDDGVKEGGEVSMFYDPMIAKLITWGNTRDEAADLQVAALDRFELEGLGNNIDFLSALMQHARFRSGELTTGFIAEEYPDGFEGAPADAALTQQLSIVAATLTARQAERGATISGQLGNGIATASDWVVRLANVEHAVTLGDDSVVDGTGVRGSVEWSPGDRTATLHDGAQSLAIRVARTRAGWTLTTRGAAHKAQVYSPRVAELARHMIEKIPPDMSRFLLCPMPGLLTRVEVTEGDKVEAGQPLAVVEAMKMENILRAEKSGVVKSVNFAAGESLAVDAAILEFE